MIPPHNPTIFKAFFEAYKINSNKEAIHYKKDSFYISLTYRQLYVQSIQFARILEAFELKPGDAAVIILENTPLWPVAFLGLNSLGLVAVPLNNQLPQDEILPLILHSEAKLVITSLANEEKIKAATWGLKIKILVIDQPDVLRKITLDSPEEVHPKQFSADSVCVLAYTSGTTANPKGVLLTHKNILANIESIKLLNLINSRDCLVSFLPLYHIYAFTVTMLLPLLIQARMSFPKNLDIEEIMDCLRNTGVTIFPGVPRLFSLLQERINLELKRRFFLVRWLLNSLLALSLPLRKYLRINLAKVILYQLHAKFGSSLRFLISGGAKLNEDVAQALYKWGFTILEGYGLTETSPVISFNSPSSFKLGSAGRPVSGVQVKIDTLPGEQSGEILVRGQNITSGYFKDPHLSNEVIKDGWFYTNDLGYLDKAGYLYITGRKNEIIVLPSGKKINPEELEPRYAKSPFIEELCIIQPRFSMDKDMLTAIVKPNLAYLRARGVSQIEDKVRWEIDNCAVDLPFYNRIKKVIITNEPLPRTILGKLKRFEITEKFAELSKISSEQISIRTKAAQKDDSELLSSPLCQEAMKYLSLKAKRPVDLDDHLELDLGLDSLERIGLFFDFQKFSKVMLDEKTFFFVHTVRDVLRNLKAQATAKPQGATDQDWSETLKDTTDKELEKSVSLRQTILSKAINILFIESWQIACRLLFLLNVKGKDHLPQYGSYILCPNHTSYLDALLVMAAVGGPRAFLRTYMLGYRAYIDFPLIKWAKKLFRLIPIDPGLDFSRDLKVCSWVLQNAKILCIFPEGRRSMDGRIKEFKAGAGVLIKELGAPVVPVYIKGAERAWPVHRMLPCPSKIEVTFGRPLTPEELMRKKKEGVDMYKNIVDNLRESLLDLERASFKEQSDGKKV